MTPDDDQILRMLAGAHFGPGAKVILPSGLELGADEMQALTSAYAPPRNCDSTGDQPKEN